MAAKYENRPLFSKEIVPEKTEEGTSPSSGRSFPPDSFFSFFLRVPFRTPLPFYFLFDIDDTCFITFATYRSSFFPLYR